MKTSICFLTVLSFCLLVPSCVRTPQQKFSSIESIVAVIPATVALRSNGNWNVDGIADANKAVIAEAQNRPATLRLTVQVSEPFTEEGWAYRIMAPDGKVSIRDSKMPYRIWAYFRPDQTDTFAKLQKGSTVTLSGRLGRADIKMFRNGPALSIDLHEAKITKE